MILKLAYGGTTEMIECGQVRCESRRFDSVKDAQAWAKSIGTHSGFGADLAAMKAKNIFGYYLALAPYNTTHEEGKWQHIICWACGVFLMNENGKTVEIFSR